MSREYVDRGPYLCRYEARHGWVVYLNDAGDLKHLCSTNAEAKAKDIVGIMNADVAQFDAKMRAPAPAPATAVVGSVSDKGSARVEEARKAMDAAMVETTRLEDDPATRFTGAHGRATYREMEAVKAYRAALLAGGA